MSNYKTPMRNQNKGYESRDLKDMPIISRATVGSSISKHMTTPTHMMGSLKGKGSPNMKTESRIEKDLGRNIAADKKAGKTKDAKAEAKQLMRVADGSQKY